MLGLRRSRERRIVGERVRHRELLQPSAEGQKGDQHPVESRLDPGRGPRSRDLSPARSVRE